MANTLPVLKELPVLDQQDGMNEPYVGGRLPIEQSTRRIGMHVLKIARIELAIRDRREQCATELADVEQKQAELIERDRQLSLRETALEGRAAELAARRVALRRQAAELTEEGKRIAAAGDEWRERHAELERCEALVAEFDAHFERITASFQLDALQASAKRFDSDSTSVSSFQR